MAKETTEQAPKPLMTADGVEVTIPGMELWIVGADGTLTGCTLVQVSPRRRQATLRFESGRETVYRPHTGWWQIHDANLFADWRLAKKALVTVFEDRLLTDRDRLESIQTKIDECEANLELARTLQNGEGLERANES